MSSGVRRLMGLTSYLKLEVMTDERSSSPRHTGLYHFRLEEANQANVVGRIIVTTMTEPAGSDLLIPEDPAQNQNLLVNNEDTTNDANATTTGQGYHTSNFSSVYHQ
eukprot:scaffold33608_cov169-Skeletonema_dohrnii-CCMP3373.AAC.3